MENSLFNGYWQDHQENPPAKPDGCAGYLPFTRIGFSTGYTVVNVNRNLVKLAFSGSSLMESFQLAYPDHIGTYEQIFRNGNPEYFYVCQLTELQMPRFPEQLPQMPFAEMDPVQVSERTLSNRFWGGVEPLLRPEHQHDRQFYSIHHWFTERDMVLVKEWGVAKINGTLQFIALKVDITGRLSRFSFVCPAIIRPLKGNKPSYLMPYSSVMMLKVREIVENEEKLEDELNEAVKQIMGPVKLFEDKFQSIDDSEVAISYVEATDRVKAMGDLRYKYTGCVAGPWRQVHNTNDMPAHEGVMVGIGSRSFYRNRIWEVLSYGWYCSDSLENIQDFPIPGNDPFNWTLSSYWDIATGLELANSVRADENFLQTEHICQLVITSSPDEIPMRLRIEVKERVYLIGSTALQLKPGAAIALERSINDEPYRLRAKVISDQRTPTQHLVEAEVEMNQSLSFTQTPLYKQTPGNVFDQTDDWL